MDFIYNLIQENILNALGWTVLHSLWQAFLVALILAAYLLFWQKTNAQKRYWAGCLAMGSTLLFSVITFFVILKNQSTAGVLAAEIINAENNFNGQLIFENSTSAFADYFNKNMPLIVSAWLLGMLFFMLKTLGGLLYIQRLKTRHLNAVPEQWHILKNKLQSTLGISQKIKLTASALVKVPMVVGWLKPVILMPVAAINQLTTEQVEAILAHELAHVARYDYFINILQTIVEALFYFNPAVWWISSRIRVERENCCDDMAVAACGNSIAYARALVSLQEMHQAQPMLALSFSKNKNQLLSRIQRILQSPDKKSNAMEKITATVLLLGTVLLLSVQAQTNKTPKAENENVFTNESTSVSPDTIPGIVWDDRVDGSVQIVKKNGDVVEMKFDDGDIENVKVNGEEQDVEAYKDYLNEIDAKEVEMINVWKDTIPPASRLPKGPLHYSRSDGEGENVEVKVKNGKIKYLQIDGEVIDPADYAKHMDMVEDLLSHIPPPPPPPPSPFSLAAPDAPVAPDAPKPLLAPSPPAPPAGLFAPPKPPLPPAPPAPPVKKRKITTEKNGQGMTIIIEGANGEDPVEIEIENSRKGNVTINGNEIKGLKDGDKTVIVEDLESAGFTRRYYDQANDRMFWFPNGELLADSPFPEIADEPNLFLKSDVWPDVLFDEKNGNYFKDLAAAEKARSEELKKSFGEKADIEKELFGRLKEMDERQSELFHEKNKREQELFGRLREKEEKQQLLFQEQQERANYLLKELQEQKQFLSEEQLKEFELKREKLMKEFKNKNKSFFEQNDRRMLQNKEQLNNLHLEMEAQQKALADMKENERFEDISRAMDAMKKNKEQMARLEGESARLLELRAKRALIGDTRRAQ